MQTNNEAAISFLRKWNPKGPWVLTAIQLDKKAISTKSFMPNQSKLVNDFLKEYNGIRNIYFHVNTTVEGITKKALKEDIVSCEWLHIDIDPEKGLDVAAEQERALSLLTDKLPNGIPKPTVIIFSGGGYQGFWKLKQPEIVDGKLELCNEFERYNKRLEQVFGGDHCHNVDRIMRLPGTINIPDAKKKKAGRVETLATCLEFNKNRVYDISEFKKAQAIQSDLGHDGGGYGVEVKISSSVSPIEDLSELDEWNVPDRVKVIIAQGRHPDQPKEGDNSRSAWLFDCVCQLIRANVPDEVIFALLTDKEWAISESILEAGPNAEKYAIRQIKRAKENAEDPWLRKMNERHAIIGNIGGRCRVIEEVVDDILGRSRLTISSFEDIRNRYSNIQIQVGETPQSKKPVYQPLGKWWINHHMRRQFDYIRFMPQGDKEGVYNLWRGFSYAPAQGDCDLFLAHLHDNVCNGDEKQYEYLIKWMARGVQKPATSGQVAIVMRGGKGVGKSIVASIYGKLFGRHHLHVANPSHLVGNFNAHLRDVIVLFADEAFFAGDKKHESVLKMLVTEDSIPIEAKGVDVETYPNYVHLIMAANDTHVIRATGDERRYFVVEVSDKHKQDKEYFGNIFKQMENGGYEALLYYLQELDISDFQVRNVPQTQALQEQKLLSLSIDEEWWYRKLQNGRLVESDVNWTESISCDKLVSDFTSYAEKWKFTRRGNETALGRFLKRVCPHLIRTQRRIVEDDYDSDGRAFRTSKRAYVYDFGKLEDCRQSWVTIHGETEWEDQPELDIQQPPQEVF